MNLNQCWKLSYGDILFAIQVSVEDIAKSVAYVEKIHVLLVVILLS